MVVYGELLFIENMIIGGVLLYLTGEICGRSRGIYRFAAGSMMCGLFSLVIFLDAKVPFMMLMEAGFSVAVCIVVFGCKRRGGKRACLSDKLLSLKLPWRKAVVFIMVTYFMGGLVMGIFLVTRQQGIHTAVGIYTGDMKAAALALFICIGHMTIKQIIKTVRSRKLHIAYTYEAEIVIDEHIIKATAFLDTGNKLKDPLTGKPVAVASEDLWNEIMNECMKDCLMQQNTRFAVVPYEVVGAAGVMQAVRVDRIDVGGKQTRGVLIARSKRDFKLDDGLNCLISGEMIELKFERGKQC